MVKCEVFFENTPQNRTSVFNKKVARFFDKNSDISEKED